MDNQKKLVLGAHIGLARRGSKNYTTFTGTGAVSNGSDTLTGSGTTFTGLAEGDTLAIKAASGEITLVTIDTITSDTVIVMATEWAGDTDTGLVLYSETGAVAGPSIKPVSSVPANWRTIGEVMESEFKQNAEYDDTFAPQPAVLQKTGQLLKKVKPEWTMKTNQLTETVFESLVMAGAEVVDSAAFTPFAGDGLIEGWWQVKKLDQPGNVILLIEIYGIASVTGLKTGNGHIQPEINLGILYNALATATTKLAAAA